MRGLYSPRDERDNCGFGLTAHVQGEASHDLLQRVFEALNRMSHRGGVAADGRTGDGCGILMQKPDAFLRREARETLQVELGECYGVGTVFLDPDPDKASAARRVLEQQLENAGLEPLGWRPVPVNPASCGELARRELPRIEQIFLNAPSHHDPQHLNGLLSLVRRRAEMALGSANFYVCSLSATVCSYKGLLLPKDFTDFFPDLKDPAMATAICMFHVRFSTNTAAYWSLSQPFRLLAHNGEINTICGNRNWAEARRHMFRNSRLPELADCVPLVSREGSDSSSLDNILELLLAGGMDLYRATRLVMPPAWEHMEDAMDADLRAFFACQSVCMEPWDGPAGVVMTDGSRALCMLDRNGLRPARYVLGTDGHITLASETGTYDYPAHMVAAKGRVGPGQLLAVDTRSGKILLDGEINQQLQRAQPYRKWLARCSRRLAETPQEDQEAFHVPREELPNYRKMFLLYGEEKEQVLRPMAETGQEAVGSMGDDTPMAVLSRRIRPLYDYFRQQFAQVTNPPIDSLRESLVMSLETRVGKMQDLFTENEERTHRLVLDSPILHPATFRQLARRPEKEFAARELPLHYDPDSRSLRSALEELAAAAEQAVREGAVLLVLEDRGISPQRWPLPAPLAVGAVHQRLITSGLRCAASILVATGSARDAHHVAVLLSLGATAVCPYLGFRLIHHMLETGELEGDAKEIGTNYRKGLEKGLRKILSKMGISCVSSYRGAQLFEVVGLSREITELCGRELITRIGGADFEDLEEDQRTLARQAWDQSVPVPQGGILKFVHDAEYHCFNPDVIASLHSAVRSGEEEDYRRYAQLVQQRPPAALRDLLRLRKAPEPLPLEEVEPESAILCRFDSAGMSLGALSPEAHESLALAMNQLGGRSNSGEGGEDPERYGTPRNSAIKQIASGRFGVTPRYLMSAAVLQIKIAQGAKPGEGGQLPGGKVNQLIARLRYSVPGVTLISPPPHHDIYSIEDLAQLIYDLKQVNPEALVSVKLVAEPGVGTVASGVAKTGADLITISGYDGGTAASPLSSIRYAGCPWELGLSESHQTLCANGLRTRVRLQVDGGLKTGLDVIKGAILGAESFGFGTTPMVALGCKYLRICHLNNCATGIATQNERLRKEHYHGTVQMVLHFFHFLAHETRCLLAQLGKHSLEEIIGCTALLETLPGTTPKQEKLHFAPILHAAQEDGRPVFCQVERNAPRESGSLAARLQEEVLPAIRERRGGHFHFPVSNQDRAVGALLSGAIAARYGDHAMETQPVVLHLQGTAGQSLGAWNAGGLHIHLEGDANDYVGKGMAGGKIVLRDAAAPAGDNDVAPIMGNTCLYGATGGILYAAGGAGERFGVRNSGAHAVIEGAGDHCCEYMTGGMVLVLGETGYNFGAGMTGGLAYVLDEKQRFTKRYNPEFLDIHPLDGELPESCYLYLVETLGAFVAATGSPRGQRLLGKIKKYRSHFLLVKPRAKSLSELASETAMQLALVERKRAVRRAG